MGPAFEVAVVGLGAAGSATLQALARRGVRAVGFDLHHPPHNLGSSHGRSRIIREAYYESPAYVPLVQQAYAEWARIGRDTGRDLLVPTGGLMLGPPEGELVEGARRSAETHGLPHEVLDTRALRRRFPVFDVEDGTAGVYEPRAGFLDPEGCVAGCLELAERGGAELRFGCRVEGWERVGDGIRLATGQGRVDCGRVILAAGAWLPDLVPHAVAPIRVERQVMFWFGAGAEFRSAAFPVFIREWDRGRFFYGIPDHGHGLKVARHHEGDTTAPERVDRTVRPDEVAGIRELLRRFLPRADGPPIETAVCLYSNTPDHHFLIGLHPGEPRLILASACSGHGFKFAGALGEILADLALGRRPAADLTLFSPDRFRG